MKKFTIDQFIEKSIVKHGHKYNYSETVFKTTKDNVIIICPKHGKFNQKAEVHLRGCGCPKCGDDASGPGGRLTTDIFIERSSLKHNDFYDYSLANYTSSRIKVEIICPIHGIFKQAPKNHMDGQRCPLCEYEKRKGRPSKTKLSLDEVLKRFFIIHGNIYDYSKTIYLDIMQKIEIICREHGSFWQSPDNHLRGQGCPTCGQIQRLKKSKAPGWSRTEWIKFCEEKNCKYPVVYLVKMFSNDETFIKIGITNDFKKRHFSKHYKSEKLNLIYGKPIDVYNLEDKLHQMFKNYKYLPDNKFKGHTECFDLSVLENETFKQLLIK